jgi:uncharacterized membrane protein YhaH (DUF805 family)
MASVNPYRAPAAAVADSAEQFQPVRIFAVAGRVGRARYIAYSIGLSFLIMLVFGFIAGFAGAGGSAEVAMAAMGSGYLFTFILMFMLTIQRAHDFNTTGWLSILVLIPLVNLLFWFIPGTDGENRYGAQTPPNSVLVLIAVWILPVLFVGGIVAAIALPAYQGYVKRAQAKQFQQK